MKQTSRKIGYILIAIALMLGVGFLITQAQISAPSGGAPTGQPPTFLNVGADNQIKDGWLAIGTTNQPGSALDVFGSAVTNSLLVELSASVKDKLIVGSVTPVTSSALDVSGYIASNNLAGVGEREVCANASGVLEICGAAPQCSDGIDNDNDGNIDFAGGPNGELADPNCDNANDNDESGFTSPPTSNISVAPTGCYGDQGYGGYIHDELKCPTVNDDDGNEIAHYEIQHFDPSKNDIVANNTWETIGIHNANNSVFTIYSTLRAVGAFRARAVTLDQLDNVDDSGPWSVPYSTYRPNIVQQPVVDDTGFSISGGATVDISWGSITNDNWVDPFMKVVVWENCIPSDSSNTNNCTLYGGPAVGATINYKKLYEGYAPNNSVSVTLEGSNDPLDHSYLFVQAYYDNPLSGGPVLYNDTITWNTNISTYNGPNTNSQTVKPKPGYVEVDWQW